MAVLLKDAIKPNLVQTLEGQPAFVHCGPFANIAHGNNSLVADLVALKLGDYVVTESGFGSDMGMEKFLDIVCRRRRHPSERRRARRDRPRAQASRRGARRRGAGDRARRGEPRPPSRHRRRSSGSRRSSPSTASPATPTRSSTTVRRLALEHGAHAAEINDGVRARRRRRGGARRSRRRRSRRSRRASTTSIPTTRRSSEKIEAIAKRAYGADGVYFLPAAENDIKRFTEQGLGNVPICMAKTHLSISHDPALLNAPTGFTVPVRDRARVHGRRLARRALRRHADDARPRRYARRLQRRHRRRRPHRRAVLTCHARAVAHDRAALLHSALRLSYFTIAWNGAVGAAALVVAVTTGSLVLAGFALNALLDSLASIVLVWRFTHERRNPEAAERVERRAQAAIGAAMLLIAAYIGVQGVRALVDGSHAETSTFAVVLAAVSLLVLPVLGLRKREVAVGLESPALGGDAVLTLAAATLAAVTLCALVANAWLGWWWADPLAALVIAAALGVEGTRVLVRHRFG